MFISKKINSQYCELINERIMQKAVFLDRDGVLVHDRGIVTQRNQLLVMERVPEALLMLKRQGYLLIVVTNQAVVARGLLSLKDLDSIHQYMEKLLLEQGAPALDAIYCCPHHPNANVKDFRLICACRKPKPGMLMKAALDLEIDLRKSYMIGDRLSDILAGQLAGCHTFLVKTGQHLASPIEGTGDLSEVHPDQIELDLFAVAKRITSTP